MILTMEHQWVKLTQTPVHVMTDSAGKAMMDGEGFPVILVDPEQQEISEESTVYGCSMCGGHITEAINTKCEGVMVDE